MTLFFIGFGCIAYGFLIEPKTLKVREVEISSTKYSGDPIRIGLITDIHIGGMHVAPERVKKLVKTMNGLNPDLVLIPGDFVSGHKRRDDRSEIFNQNIAEGIGHLSALKVQSFATIGNHDAWWSTSGVTQLLEVADVTVLENDAASHEGICLVGLADFLTSTPDRSAYEGCPVGLPPLILTHSPDAWRDFRRDAVLAVAGHTHGGQVNLPFIGRRVNSTSLGPEHSYGFSKLGGVDVFVSAGVGTSILPVRFRAPPEIVVITLRAAE